MKWRDCGDVNYRIKVRWLKWISVMGVMYNYNMVLSLKEKLGLMLDFPCILKQNLELIRNNIYINLVLLRCKCYDRYVIKLG